MSLTWFVLSWAHVFCGSCEPYYGSRGLAVALVASSVVLMACVVALGACAVALVACAMAFVARAVSCGLCYQQPRNSHKAFLPVALSHRVSASQRLLRLHPAQAF